MIQYYIRKFFRRTPLRRSHWRSFCRLFTFSVFIFIFLSIIMSITFTVFILRSVTVQPEITQTNIIISLTTVPARFHIELPFTIHSLLSQTQLPKQIRIYLSPRSTIMHHKNISLIHLKVCVEAIEPSEFISDLFDKLVQIRFEQEDYGPATKYLPIIKEFELSIQPIMICDDDQYYHPFTIATLNEYSVHFPNSIIGFRGWRVRKDLIWGVGGKSEMARHIIESHQLFSPYRVGVLTANYAYLIRPLFFDPHIYQSFNLVPDDIRHVDDIWLNGHATKKHISRYVIPSCCYPISITQTHALEEYLRRNQMNRLSANNHALFWFAKNWEPDLWYNFHDEDSPKYRTWLTAIDRVWIGIVLKLRFIFRFGLI